MKTQVVHSTPTTLGPFLRLILKLTAQHDAETAENLQRPVGEAPELSVAAAIDQQHAPEASTPCLYACHELGTVLDAVADFASRHFLDRSRLVGKTDGPARSHSCGALHLAVSAANLGSAITLTGRSRAPGEGQLCCRCPLLIEIHRRRNP